MIYISYFNILYLILCILNLIRTLIFSPKYHKIVLVLHTHISIATRMSYECPTRINIVENTQSNRSSNYPTVIFFARIGH